MSGSEDTPPARSKNAEKLRRWREANREKYLAQRRADYQRNREKRLAAARVYRETNPEAVKARRAAWYSANRDRAVAYAVEWARANPERRRERDRRRYVKRVTSSAPGRVEETEAAIASILLLPCAYCGATGKVELDHVVPLSRGGRHEPENFAPACKSCNSSKGAKLLPEWRPDDFHVFDVGPGLASCQSET